MPRVFLRRLPIAASAITMAVLLAACSSGPRRSAPVEDRGFTPRPLGPSSSAGVPAGSPAAASLPGAENAGKPGYYSVRPGDTLVRIALDNGQNWRDIARWNGLSNPNVIEVGQVLRVVPPGAVAQAPASAAGSSEVVTRPIAQGSVTASPMTGPGSAPAAPAASASAAASAASAASAPAATSPDDDIPWAWPTAPGSTVIAGFDEARNKGLDIAGKAGDPVLAAADGRVVYAGSGLRGYGNLIILKHNNTYLTAYAHNQALLVKEDQTVKRGQKIAEMGSTDSDRVKLHFEIRRQGKPVDPARWLPAR